MAVRQIEPIDRAELRATIQKWIDAHTDVDDTDGVGLLEDVLWEINAQPTLTPPEIVYCQDCVHHKAYEDAVVESGLAAAAGNEDAAKSYELFKAGLSALRPVRLEQVKRAEWIWSTGDVYTCSSCGEKTHVDECMENPIYNFCPFCMAPMTDEAVDMVMERLEKIK